MVGPSLMNRAGKIKVAALVWLALLVSVTYVGVEIGGVYWRRYKLEETVQQRLGFATQLSDEAIHRQLVEDIAGMNLPPEAQNIRFQRTQQPRALRVSISYVETVDLFVTAFDLTQRVQVTRSF